MQEQLDSEAKRKLQAFVSQADRLSSCKFFKNGKPDLTLALGDEFTKALVPEREEFIAMLTTLRPFTNNGDSLFLNKVVGAVRRLAELDASSLNRLNSVSDKFKFYKGDYDQKSSKYQQKYSKYVYPFSDMTCDFGERTISHILNLIVNGYYFHFDIEKQREFVDFLKEQQKKWIDPYSETDLASEQLTVVRQRVRETFKFRFYELIIALASCVLELKNLIQEFFDFPLDEELRSELQISQEFLDI